MTVAILMSGQVRSLEWVWPQIYEHLLSKNDCVLFVLSETDNEARLREILATRPDVRIGGIETHANYRSIPEYANIVNLTLNSGRAGVVDASFRRGQDKDGLAWTEFGRSFIQNSGSILQWYQLWKLFNMMTAYERENHMKFTHCMRTRTDLQFYRDVRITDQFLTDNPHFATMQTPDSVGSYGDHHVSLLCNKAVDDDAYVITFAVDLGIIATRATFAVLSNMVFHYGLYDVGQPFSFSSEHCFHQFCAHQNLTHYVIQEKDFPLYSNNTADEGKGFMFIILRK